MRPTLKYKRKKKQPKSTTGANQKVSSRHLFIKYFPAETSHNHHLILMISRSGLFRCLRSALSPPPQWPDAVLLPQIVPPQLRQHLNPRQRRETNVSGINFAFTPQETVSATRLAITVPFPMAPLQDLRELIAFNSYISSPLASTGYPS